MRITKNIYLVGSGHYGLSNEFDCSIYVVDCQGQLALIDAGLGRQPELMVQNMENDGLDPEKISAVLLTHSHADHGGGAAWFKNRYGCLVYISKEEEDIVNTGDEKKLSLDVAKKSGLYYPDYQFEPCPETRSISDGDTIEVNQVIFESIIVPGHSQGSTCFKVNLEEGLALFTGDVVFAEGIIGLLNCNGSGLGPYRENIGKLADLDIELLFPGHRVFVVSEGQKHIDTAIEALQQLSVPKNFI